ITIRAPGGESVLGRIGTRSIPAARGRIGKRQLAARQMKAWPGSPRTSPRSGRPMGTDQSHTSQTSDQFRRHARSTSRDTGALSAGAGTVLPMAIASSWEAGPAEQMQQVPQQVAGTSLELFTGGGGLAWAMHQAGFRHLLVNEYEHRCCETLRENMAVDLDPPCDRPWEVGTQWPLIEGDVRKV